MSLVRRVALSSVALTVVLSSGVQPVSSWDEPWGGAWRRDQGDGYDPGYGQGGVGAYDWEGRRSASPLDSPSWAPEPSGPSRGSPTAGAGPYADYEPPNTWVQGPPRPVSTGDYSGLTQRRPLASDGPSPAWSEHQSEVMAPGFPARGPSEAVRPGPGSMRSVPGAGHLDPRFEAYPRYRFRGDPPSLLGHWESAPYDTGYRFRPLTEQERGRLPQEPDDRGGRYPQDSRGAPFPSEPWLQPETAYGFEPNPWRAR